MSEILDAVQVSPELRKIQKLFERAEHPNTPEAERDSCLAKANDMMNLYQITHWDLQKAKPKGQEEKPIRSSEFEVSPMHSDISDELTSLFSAVAEHCGVLGAYHHLHNNIGWPVTVLMVGYKDDVEFCQMMYVSLVNQLMQRVDPKPDPALPLDENVAQQKGAGRQWESMHNLFIEAGMVPSEPFTKPIGLRYYDLYRKYCARTGEAAVKANPKNYKRNFAFSYAIRIGGRLSDIREQQLANEKRGDQGKMEIMFREKKYYVEEAFREFFPRLGTARPKGGFKFNGQAFGAGSSAADDSDLGAMKVRSGTHRQSSSGALPSGGA